MRNLSRLMMVGWFAAALSGCDDGGSDDGGGAGATGMAGSGSGTAGTGAGGGSSGPGTPVAWDTTGWVEGTANPFGIQGPWYSYEDCADAMPAGLTCTTRDPGLTGPDMKTGWSVDATKVCAKGTAAAVQNMMYDKQWGFGIALDLNNPGMGAAKGPYNASGPGIKGFSFNITGSGPPKIRINVTQADPDNAAHFREVSVPSTAAQNQVVFTDTLNFKQGSWITTPTPFDPSKVYAIQFQVFTNTAGPTPFDFCVSDFKVIQ